MGSLEARRVGEGDRTIWVLSNPVVVTARVQPLKPSAAIPTFHRVDTSQGASH
jgi:hypothetical protein